jgi:polar amino acid transport system substrate-binding protein
MNSIILRCFSVHGLDLTRRLVLALALLAAAGKVVAAQSLAIYTEVSPPEQIQGPNGKLSGIAIDTVQEIQKRIGNKDPIKVMPWARAYQEAQSIPNVLLFSMSRSAERDPLFQWVGPINETVYGFWVRAASTVVIKSLDDAKKLGRIGVYRDDVRDLFLTKAGFTNLDRTVDNVTNVKKAMSNRIDAFASSRNGIAEEAKAAGFKREDFKEAFPFFKVQIFLAFSKSTPKEVVVAWQSALDAMKKDKTFERIFHSYLPNNPLPGPAITNF